MAVFATSINYRFCRKSTTLLKLFLFIALFQLTYFKAYTQVSVYGFSQQIVGYTPFSGTPTVAYAAPWDNHTAGAAHQATLPFSFVFDGATFNSCYISPNGFITFGATQPGATNYVPNSSTDGYTGSISALGIDLISAGNDIIYGIEGVAPNRTFVIQWTNAVRKIDTGNFNFQIRLNETTNVIELNYGICNPNGTTNRPVQVGLRGANNNFPQGNVQNRSDIGISSAWFSNSNNGTLNSSTLRTDTGSFPDTGLKYIYTPPPACVTPAGLPSSLILGATSITNNSINGNSFTAASPAPTNYLILRSTVNVLPVVTNRTFYPNGSTIGGTHLVISNAATTTFNQTGLAANTTYYYWIIPYNTLCTGAPFYNSSSILTASATTCSPPTTATAATSVGGNDFVANWGSVAGATNYIIDIATNATFTAFVPGYNNLSVGIVTTLPVTGLLPNTTYYYRVRAIGASCVINSNTITVATTCGYYTIPYVQNFDSFAAGIIPPCYARVDSNGDGIQWQIQSINFASASRSLYIGKSSNATTAMNDWLFSPGLNLTGGISYRLFFRYNTGNAAAFFENLRVLLGNGNNVVSMSQTLIDLPNINNSLYQVASVDFIPATSGIYYIGFQGYSNANQSYIVIDDFSVTVSPTCFAPTDLTIDSVATNTATISWTASLPAPANGYEYYYSTSSTPPTGATVPSGSVGAGVTTANLTGLLSSTYYYVWVRGNCGPSDKSVWTSDEAFSTECATPIITSTTPATRCGIGTATLSAVPNLGSTINWYDVASGGSILFNGNNFTTPIVSSTTTYYAEAKAFGAVAKVGPTSPTNEGGTLGIQNFQGAVNFNVTSNTSLLSLDIYPMVSGQAGQIVLRNSSNVTLTTFSFTTTVSGGATAQVIPINYFLTAGNYNIYFATVPTSGVRMNTNNAFYPYNGSVANIQNNTIDNTQYLGLYNWRFTTECLSARVPVTVTVTSPPALALSSTTSTICENYATPLITVSGYAAYNSLVWSPNTGISGSFATGFTFNPTVTTTYTLTANQTSGSLCGNVVTHVVIVNPAPPTVMVIPSTAAICQNSIQSLNGSASASAAIPVLSENFNTLPISWVAANTSVGGDTAASQWRDRPNGYNYISGLGWNRTFYSNDNSQFYLANSDSQSAVVGTLTRTTLTSPSFNLTGYTSASLTFWQYLAYTSLDTVLVEISTNGGGTWSTLVQHTSSKGVQGVPIANFVQQPSINLNAYIGNSNVKIRFNYTSPWGYVWGIDNVLVSATLATALTWTPATDLYTDAAGTIPYVGGTAVPVVYAKPSATTSYTATLTGANGCSTSNTTTLTVVPSSNGGTLSASQTLCTGITPSNITLSGHVGNVVRWEYADDAAFTINVTTIASTATTLTPAQMGTILSSRYFRAVVKNGICNETYSAVTSVNFPSTTWNGSAWSNGLPNATTRAVFNGNYNSSTDVSLVGTILNACSVLVQSGTITFTAGYTLNVENTVNVTSGSLIFENNASLVQPNDIVNLPGVTDGGNVGNITYRRTTTPMVFYDYTYWSSPVSPQTLVALSPQTLFDKYFIFNQVTNYWQSVPSNSLMDAGKGYIIRAPQDHINGAVFNGTFIGKPNSGNITTPIVVAAGDMNLIGNPYPSSLRAISFLSDPLNTNVVDATMYFWTHNTPITANNYTANDYAMFNYSGGTATASPAPGANNTTPNGFVASGQSFFIKGINTGGTVTFKNSMRGASYTNSQFYRTTSTSQNVSEELNILSLERNRLWLDLINTQGAFKQTLVGYIQTATNGMDRGFDGLTLDAGNSVSLYSIVGENKLGIQGRTLPFDVNDVVPLGYSTTINGTFEIRLSNYDGLFADQAVYLEDKLLNIIHNLKESNYSFVTEVGTFNNRFQLRYMDTALSTNEFDINSLVLYGTKSDVAIKSGVKLIKQVKVYDMRGRLLQTLSSINAMDVKIDLGTTNQVFLIQITLEDDSMITKKYTN